jgi:hypothetical protein
MHRVVLLLLILACSAEEARGPAPGVPLPEEIKAALAPLEEELMGALSGMDAVAARSVCERMTEAMGPWAGTPEVAYRFWAPLERKTPDMAALWRLWGETETHTMKEIVWDALPDGNPARLPNGMRLAGRPVIAFARVSGLRPEERDRYLELVKKGADWLLDRQRPDGLFPFPDIRGRHKLFTPLAERVLERNPNAIVDGWIVDDAGEGHLKYDNAIAGVALAEAHAVTGDPRYLAGARRACEWALTQPLCDNWNYNAFSVWLLARVARETGDPALLEGSVTRCLAGVMPGQMADGRWLDPHNARMVYHGILVRGILEVWLALPDEDPRKQSIRDSVVRALDAASALVMGKGAFRENGASSNSTMTESFSRALMHLGPKPNWEEALSININAGLHILKDHGAPFVNLYLADYLAYRAVAPQ